MSNRTGLVLSALLLAVTVGLFSYGEYNRKIAPSPPSPVAEPVTEETLPPNDQFYIYVNTGNWLTSKRYLTEELQEAVSPNGLRLLVFRDKNSGNILNVYFNSSTLITIEKIEK